METKDLFKYYGSAKSGLKRLSTRPKASVFDIDLAEPSAKPFIYSLPHWSSFGLMNRHDFLISVPFIKPTLHMLVKE